MNRDVSLPNWTSVGLVGDMILALEWKRGEPCPTVARHKTRLRLAREYLAELDQQGDEACGAVLMTDDGHGDMRRVGLFDPNADAWCQDYQMH